MTFATPTHASFPPSRAARIRPTTAAAVFGAVVGLGVGCAYLGGMTAKATTVRAQAERLEGATAAGFTEEALSAAAGGLDASALTIARRHDPYSVAGGAQRDRQAELLTARLEQLRSQPDGSLRRVSLTASPAAQPFRMGSTLDSSRDLECLTQAVYYEARGEGRDGMQAVAQVVLNRARHPAFPKSVCGVVFQGAGLRTGCQFSFTCDGSMRARISRPAWDRARGIALAALSGSVYAGVGNATHFHTTGVSPGWRNSLIRVSQIGSHLFYRFGGRGGSGEAFRYAVRPSASASPQLIQASIDPVAAARQAGQAVAYSLVLAQEGVSNATGGPAHAEPSAPAPQPTAQASQPTSVSVAPPPAAASADAGTQQPA